MKTKIYFSLALTLLNTIVYSQSPWTQGQNKAYIQVGLSGIFYNKIRSNEQNIDLNKSISDITSQLYTEYGVTNNVDATIILPYKTIDVKYINNSAPESLSGFGNISIGLKYKFYDHKWKMSAGFLFSANSIKSNQIAALRTGYEAATWFPYLAVGSSNNKIYYFTTFGYGNVSNNYTDFIKTGGEFGYNFIKKTHLILNVDFKKALKTESYFDSDSNAIYSSTALYNDRQEFNAIGIKINHEFKTDKFGINIGAIGAFYLNNLPAAPSFNTGIYYKL